MNRVGGDDMDYLGLDTSWKYKAGTTDGTSDTGYLYEQQVSKGYCFDCDKPVDVLYWPVKGAVEGHLAKCTECGGTDCAFLDRVSRRLLEKQEQETARSVVKECLRALGCGE